MTEPEQTHHGDKPLVLVVEDEVLIRMAIADAFRDAGFTVIEAGAAQQALDVLGAGYKPDVLFTDVRMPGEMDGIALAGRLQEMLPDLRIMITSAHLSSGDEKFRHNFVPKPYDPELVVSRVKRLLED